MVLSDLVDNPNSRALTFQRSDAALGEEFVSTTASTPLMKLGNMLDCASFLASCEHTTGDQQKATLVTVFASLVYDTGVISRGPPELPELHCPKATRCSGGRGVVNISFPLTERALSRQNAATYLFANIVRGSLG